MAYAIIITTNQNINMWTLDGNGNQIWGPVASVSGTISDLIVYDGISAYIPPTNTKLQAVPDTAKIGDTGF